MRQVYDVRNEAESCEAFPDRATRFLRKEISSARRALARLAFVPDAATLTLIKNETAGGKKQKRVVNSLEVRVGERRRK